MSKGVEAHRQALRELAAANPALAKSIIEGAVESVKEKLVSVDSGQADEHWYWWGDDERVRWHGSHVKGLCVEVHYQTGRMFAELASSLGLKL